MADAVLLRTAVANISGRDEGSAGASGFRGAGAAARGTSALGRHRSRSGRRNGRDGGGGGQSSARNGRGGQNKNGGARSHRPSKKGGGRNSRGGQRRDDDRPRRGSSNGPSQKLSDLQELCAEQPRGGHGRRGGKLQQQQQRRKPDLWAAVELGDEAAVTRLLKEGRDPDERYSGWTPLMKASEEGLVEIMRHLLKKSVDVEAKNKKGRSALSFAAAPSMNGSTARPTRPQAIRLLLEHGVDPTKKDERGKTAKERAAAEKRTDAVLVFEEFENRVPRLRHGTSGDVTMAQL